MTVPEPALGLSFYFETGAIAGDEVVGQLLAGTAAVIRRYLDDPVSTQVVGRRPDPRRNAFLSLLLAIDRAGFEPGSLSVMPLEPVCRPAAHAGETRCPFCAVLHLVAESAREGLLRVRAVAGDKDQKGRYYRATDLAIDPGPALDGYRERIKRLSLPPLLPAQPAPRAHPDAQGEAAPRAGGLKSEAAAGLLATIYAGSWKEVHFAIGAGSFQVGGVAGSPGDLGLDPGGWEIFCELARNHGQLQPALLGDADADVAARVAALAETLKRAFPQIPGEPIRSSGTGGFDAEFSIRAEDMLAGEI
jgi:hypothetical protein